MIINCEECGKRYRIDPDKIKGDQARFKCKACGNLVTVTKPGPEIERSMPSVPVLGPAAEDSGSPPPPDAEPLAKERPELRAGKPGRSRKRGMGLRKKMILLFFFVPIVLVAVAGVLYLWQLGELSSFLTRESSRLSTQMAEERIAETAKSVAQQARLYLLSHKDLMEENFNSDPIFKGVSVQKVGLTGYTALYELPGEDGIWRTWAHANPKIIGIDMKKLAKPLGDNFPGFWGVFTGVKGRKESKGYYTWKDQDGAVRDKYMVCTPVEGFPYVIAATTYLDEFTMPIKVMEARAEKSVKRTKTITLFIFGGTLLLIGLIVSIYGHRLTRRIKTLTEIADRISVGELDTEIDIKSRDELGGLAEAITRMQDSIRLSIERLRRRR
ncbi:MAG: zinc-ribbon domain-containing protein [Deltaproteobacteria bacterium]|nr:zinc-ribbon domain-containing protein [Deltaproteobacteria bacterium]